MEEDTDQSDKTEEPSAHRIEEFRKRGEVAVSRELNSVVILSGTIFVFFMSIAFIYQEFEALFFWISRQDIQKIFYGEHFKEFVHHISTFFLKIIAPVLGTSFLLGFFSSVAQTGFLFASDVLSIKMERIHPINGLKRLFTFKSSMEAIKGILKFTLVLSIAYVFSKREVHQIVGFLHSEAASSFVFAKMMLLKIAFSIIGGMILVALIDFSYQKYSYRKKLMMTKQQAKRESKEREGSPEIKQKIRNIQKDLAKKRMMENIPKADVIVTNPTHISVALKFDGTSMAAPLLVAKGADFLALKIRELAKEHNIPMVENVPLARGLYKAVKVNHAIPRTFYQAVAEVLAFVYRMKNKASQ